MNLHARPSSSYRYIYPLLRHSHRYYIMNYGQHVAEGIAESMKVHARVFLTVCVAIICAYSFEWTTPYDTEEPQGVQVSCSYSSCG